MAGFREFVTGEVLTAANVDDFLMKQSVQKYADAAARDAALGTAVAGGNALREGMVAYLDDTDEVIKYDGTDWSSVAPAIAGIGSNVVSVTKTDVFTTSSASFTAITGLTVTITPSSDTAKVLLVCCVPLNIASNVRTAIRLMRGVTAIAVGPAVGSRRAASASFFPGDGAGNVAQIVVPVTHLDSPATTSATTYTVEVFVQSGTVRVGTTVNDADTSDNSRTVSSITAIEVAA